jgi:uncharacterized protein YqeY
MLIDQINAAIIANMKAKNSVDATILKTLKADIQKVSIDTKKDIDDAMVIDVASRTVKQFSDALDIYTKANQSEQIAETQHRIDIVKAYLPEQASEDEVIAAVNEVKAKVGATTKRDMGLMMKELSPMFKGKFDQKKLSQIVSSVLA